MEIFELFPKLKKLVDYTDSKIDNKEEYDFFKDILYELNKVYSVLEELTSENERLQGEVEDVEWDKNELQEDLDSMEDELRRKCGEVEANHEVIRELRNEIKQYKEKI